MLELPNKELLRIDEVSEFFSVTDRCIRLWIEHGHLKAEKIVGSIRVTRESVLKCRFAPVLPEVEQPEPESVHVQAVEKRRGRPRVSP
jgi:hypothetical protein